MLTPMMINPGMTGADVDIRASIHHRNQWSSVVQPYQSSHFSFDSRLSRNLRRNEAFLSAGALFFNDRAGSARLNTNKGQLFLAGNVSTSSNSRLSLGITGGFGQRSIDQSQLSWGNQYDGSYDPTINSNEDIYVSQFSYFDVGSGLVWSYGEDSRYIGANDEFRFKIGYSIYHLGLQKNSFRIESGYSTGLRQVVFSTAEIGIGQTHLTIIPEIYFSRQQKFNEIIIGSSFRYLLQEGSKVTGFIKEMAITPSVSYRIGDALITAMDIQYAQYTFGLGYDINTSSLSQASRGRGAIEFHFRFQMPNPFAWKARARI
tara:strand:- start:171672 stop:172622 length:951 start_codon:yes stop_codon:yes gene_type:complete